MPDFDNLIARYIAGESVRELAGEAGINPKTIYKEIKRRDVLRPTRIEIPNLPHIIERYLAGESEQSLAKELGVSRSVLSRRLAEHGIQRRDISDSMYIRWANATPEQKSRMLDNAHEASRGSSVPDERKERVAKTRERISYFISPIENIMADWLREFGMSITQQKAIGAYNVDIAVNEPPIAIEIFGGGWHSSGEHAARFVERFKYILNQGWHVVIVWLDARHYPLDIRAANYIVTFIEELRLNPPTISQYRVIRGDGKTVSATNKYFNSQAIIDRLRA